MPPIGRSSLAVVQPTRTATYRDLASRVLARGAASALQAATLIVVARAAGPSSFGIFALALSIGYIGGSLVGVGASARILRIGAETDGRRLASALFLVRVAGSLLTCGLTLVSLLFWDAPMVVLAAAILAASDLMVDFTQAHMAGNGNLSASSALVVTQRGIVAGTVVISYFLGQFDFIWIVISCTGVFFLALVYPLRVFVRPMNIGIVLRASVGYWASGLVANFRQGEPIAVAGVVGEAAAGGYAIASRMANPLLIFSSAMQTVFVPDLARTNGTDAFSRVFRRLFLLSVSYAALLLVASPLVAELAGIFLGPEYANSRALILAMVIASGLSSVSTAYQSRFIALGQPGLSAAIIGLTTILGLGVILCIGTIFGPAYLWICPIATQLALAVGMISTTYYRVPRSKATAL